MENIQTEHLEYRSFLLRLWRDNAHHDWRVSLQSTVTQQTYHFANVEALLTFLLAEQGGAAAGTGLLPDPLPTKG